MTTQQLAQVRKLLVFIVTAAGYLLSAGFFSGNVEIIVQAILSGLGAIGIYAVKNAPKEA